ncbi:PAS domain S-box protein [Candidatus Nitrospira bockiana]
MRVLLVEDNPGDVQLLKEHLADARDVRVQLIHVSCLRDALTRLAEDACDIVLLDLSLPDSVGLDTVTRVVAGSGAKLPIVVLTSIEDEGLGLQLIQAGAQDYLVKGQVTGPLLLRSLHYAIERHRADEALRLSEERYALAIAGSNDGHWDWDLVGRTCYYSPRWKELFGIAGDVPDSDQDGFLALVHPDDRERVHEALQAHVDHRIPYAVEFRARHGAGEYRWFQSRGQAVWDTAGRAVRMAGTSTDITDRKRAEEALIESKDRYRSLIDTAGSVILVLSPDHTILEWNPAAEELYGWRRDEVLGRDYFRLFLPESEWAGVAEDIRRVLTGKETRGYENTVRARDGSEHIVSWNVNRLLDPQGGTLGIIAVGQNITERRLAEEQLRETLATVRTLSARLEGIREEERARIAREVHDELGVGLSCLKIDLSRLQAIVGAEDGPVKQEQILTRLEAMIGFTDVTIDAVHRIVTELRPTILDDLGIVAAIEWQTQEFQRRTGIACELIVSKDDIHLDPDRATAVFRICQEALTNVARHSGATRVTVLLNEDQTSTVLEISDNGSGVPADKVSDPHSFGLLGMRERAHLVGGRLTITGQPQCGTLIRLSLPQRERREEAQLC